MRPFFSLTIGVVGHLSLVVCALAQEQSKSVPFANVPAAEFEYRGMVRALREATTLSWSSHKETVIEGGQSTSHDYSISLKKPNFFRMEVRPASGRVSGVLIGDGNNLWVYWPEGRPHWDSIPESAQDQANRLTSFMMKPTPNGKHSILHEAVFLGERVGMPILDPSVFHGHQDSIMKYFDAARPISPEVIDGEDCEGIEISWMDYQRSWYLWLSRRDKLPRRIKEVVRVREIVTQHEAWTSVRVNAELTDELFRWQPPSDWTEWKIPKNDASLLKAGQPAVDFDLPASDGKRIRLSDFRDQTVILYFWRVGCPPCRVAGPFLQERYGKSNPNQVAIVGINIGDDSRIAKAYLEEHRLTFPNVLDASDAAITICEKFGGGAFPMFYVIGRGGIVRDAWVGHEPERIRSIVP